MVDTYSHVDLYDIVNEQGNSNCVDCGTSNPTWSSLNNGALICIACCEQHKYLEENISTVKSLVSDQWNDEEIKFLQYGGNNKLLNIWKEYKVNLDISIESKYNLVCTNYYRNVLKKRVEGESILSLDKPSLSDGLESLKNQSSSSNSGNTQSKKGFFGKVFLFIKKATDKLEKKMRDSGIDAKIANVFDKTANATEKVGNKIAEKSTDKLQKKMRSSGFDAKLTRVADKSVSVTEKAGHKIAEKSQKAYVSNLS